MPTTSKIESVVLGGLGHHFTDRKILTNLGWVSLENPGIKYRPQYLNSFNFATDVDEIDYISQFIREANVDTVREFYRQTNGMRLLCDKFTVPGVLFHRDDFEELDFYCVALDFSNHGGFALPAHSPENGFLIGENHHKISGKTVELYDILTSSGDIISGYFNENTEVTDRYTTIHEWLSVRIEFAARELTREISELQGSA